VLGSDLRAAQRPQLVVPPGVHQGASTTGAWSLVGTTTAPPYDDDCFTLSAADALVAGWRPAADRIRELTRS
jgi:predicted cupin superfamily sugar epimerase